MTASLRFRVLAGIFAAALALTPATPAEDEAFPLFLPGATWHGNAPMPPGVTVADFEPLFIQDGYNVFSTAGQAYSFGAAEYQGNIPTPLAAGEHVIMGTATFLNDGYVMVTNHGHVYNFGSSNCSTFDSSHLVPGDEIVKALALVSIGVEDKVKAEHDEGPLRGPGPEPIVSCSLYLFSRMGNVYALGELPWCGSVTDIVGNVVDVQLDFGSFEEATNCGYSIATDAGAVYSLGSAQFFGALDATLLGDQQVIQLEPVYGKFAVKGHVLWTDHGNSYAFGNVDWPGSLASVGAGEEVILVRLLAKDQRLLFTNLGRVEGLGGADTDGSLTPEQLGTQRIVDADIAFTGGYHLVSDAGNVYAFDDGSFGLPVEEGEKAGVQQYGRFRLVE